MLRHQNNSKCCRQRQAIKRTARCETSSLAQNEFNHSYTAPTYNLRSICPIAVCKRFFERKNERTKAEGYQHSSESFHNAALGIDAYLEQLNAFSVIRIFDISPRNAFFKVFLLEK